MDAIRQGDVIIELNAKRPKGMKKRDTDIIREGEVTGHKHRVVGNATLYSLGDLLCVEVREPSKVVHDQHSTIDLPVGFHHIEFPQEYDYITEEKRRVKD